MTTEFKYRAFISYAHTDEKWAAWLHRALETYRVPKYLVGEPTEFGPVPARIAPVFRDRDELSTATSLGDVLTQALVDSACLIVICSPAAAQSRWTNEEILTFKKLGRSDRIFCLIVDGEPGVSDDPARADDECFPPALIYEIGDDGELTDRRGEPIAADARKGKDNKHNAKLKLIAGMLGVGFDALRQREQQRRQRRLAILAAAALVGMAVTSGLAITAYLARVEAEQQRNRAQIEAETARQTTQFMVDLFEVSDPSEALGNSITAREILDKGAERIDRELNTQPVIQATLMDTMGTVYTSLGLYPEAARLVDRSLVKRRALFGNEHHEVAASLAHLGEVQTLNADYVAAEKNLRDSLRVRRVLFGNLSDEVADSATSLADVLQKQGNFDGARGMILEALGIRRELHESPHETIAASLEDLGLNYYDQGQYSDAGHSLKNAVAMRRQLHGDAHPSLAEAINNLAFALEDLGEMAEAEALYVEALEMKRRLLGDRHPEVGSGLNNLAYILRERGDFEAAELSFREALAIYEESFGEEHPDVAVIRGNLANIMYAQGETSEAIELARRDLRMRRELLGPEHPGTASAATGLGYWLIAEGEFDEAENLLFAGLDVRRKVLGEEHPQTASTMSVVANLMVETNRFEEALDYARRAQQIFRLDLPGDHWRIAVAKYYEGLALAGIGEFEMAEALLLESLKGLENARIPGLADKGREDLAEFYVNWGKPERAAEFAIGQ